MMAKAAAKAASTGDRRAASPATPELAREQGVIRGPAFGRANYVLMGVSLAVIVVGFVALGRGSITLAPILLVLGYLVLVPVALLKR